MSPYILLLSNFVKSSHFPMAYHFVTGFTDVLSFVVAAVYCTVCGMMTTWFVMILDWDIQQDSLTFPVSILAYGSCFLGIAYVLFRSWNENTFLAPLAMEVIMIVGSKIAWVILRKRVGPAKYLFF